MITGRNILLLFVLVHHSLTTIGDQKRVRNDSLANLRREALPVIFRYDGVEYRMWSNDHDPPHVHVRPAQARPEWEIIVF